MGAWLTALFTCFVVLFSLALLLTSQLSNCITDNSNRRSGSLTVRECIPWAQVVDKPASQLLSWSCGILVGSGLALLSCGLHTLGLLFKSVRSPTQKYQARNMTVNQEPRSAQTRANSEGRCRTPRRMTTSTWSTEQAGM
uniref:Uncharacterized protein n=1 Tax=Guadeloupe mosquito mononega-like virus TaxID=2607732 RepID=A0A5C1K3T9_9MONO|nr:hypothetical protein [Guadeloupe mosquito mononega-like virus]